MAKAIYVLCAFTSLVCSLLLFRAYRKKGTRLFLWICLGFLLLALNNSVLVLDLIVLPTVDLSTVRSFITLFAYVTILCGFIWEAV